MVENHCRDVALLSIYPKYAQAILNGEKNVEFRRAPISEEVTRVLIYSTAPVKKIVGYFEVEKVVMKNPLALWKDFRRKAGIQFHDYAEYYQGREKAFGIVVGKTVKLRRPIDIEELGPRLTPPQSFRYLNWNDIEDKITSSETNIFFRLKRAFNF